MCNEILLTSSVRLAIYISGLSPLVIPDKRRIRFTHHPLKLNTHTHSNECLFVIRRFITAVLPAVLDQQPWFSSYWSRKSCKFPKILLLLLLLISSCWTQWNILFIMDTHLHIEFHTCLYRRECLFVQRLSGPTCILFKHSHCGLIYPSLPLGDQSSPW